MLYASESPELFAPARSITPYNPSQQRTRQLQTTRQPISSEHLSSELLGLRFVNNSFSVAVPYLQALMRYKKFFMVEREDAAAFAQTPTAQIIAKKTFETFEEQRLHCINAEPLDVVSLRQACRLLCMSRDRFGALVTAAGLEMHKREPRSEEYSAASVLHVAAADFGKLYKWQYPQSFPIEQLPAEGMPPVESW